MAQQGLGPKKKEKTSFGFEKEIKQLRAKSSGPKKEKARKASSGLENEIKQLKARQGLGPKSSRLEKEIK